MFGPEPAFVALTLDAAIRDASAKRPRARANAMHALATAMLRDLDPDANELWHASSRHPRGAEVLSALRGGLEDEDPQIRGLALLGLGRIGAATLLANAREHLRARGTTPDEVFVRECAMIGLSHLGEAADGSAPDVHAEVLELLLEQLHSDADDIRFQAGPAVARVGGQRQLETLRDALSRETHPEVREHILVALAMLDPADEATLTAARREVLRAREDEDPSHWPAAFEAAKLLAGAGRSDGLPELVAALREVDYRDDALEAIAVIEPSRLDEPAIAEIRRICRSWLTPPITRVRAAYALARVVPDEGLSLLDRIGRSPRASVREAVRDAHAALAQLEARAR